MKKLIAISAFLLLPSLVFGAGFAKESLFLSKSPVQEGDSVRIYAVMANETSTKFEGSVVINDGSQKLGSVPVAIEAGGTQTASLAWKPTSGSHTLSAQLTTTKGEIIEQESAVFSIAAKPLPVVIPPPATSSSAAAIESSQNIQNDIAKYSPQAAHITQPVFSFFDSLRTKAADLLDAQLANVKKNLSGMSQPGLVEGTSTEGISIPQTSGSMWAIPWTIYLYILTVLRFLVGNAAVFYPLVVLVFFYFLWRMYKRMRRPSWE